MHDSWITEWAGMYEKTQHVFKITGGRVFVDSTFSTEEYAFPINPTQD